MKTKSLSNGFQLPVLGLGTWKMGGKKEADTLLDEQNKEALREALDRGYTHIDTAEGYGAGHTEELVGEVIKNFDRSKLIITTKVSPTHLAYEDVLDSAKRSLKRLDTDYVDLYLIHAPNTDIALSSTMRALDELVAQGLVKHIGVSNFNVGQLEEAQSHSKNKVVCNQIEYNLSIRNKGQFTNNMESEIIPYCQQNDILVTAYRPLVKGEVSTFQNNLLEKLSQKYQKSYSQIAINWLVSKPNIVTIVKSSNREHLRENLHAVDWEMSGQDYAALDKLGSVL